MNKAWNIQIQLSIVDYEPFPNPVMEAWKNNSTVNLYCGGLQKITIWIPEMLKNWFCQLFASDEVIKIEYWICALLINRHLNELIEIQVLKVSEEVSMGCFKWFNRDKCQKYWLYKLKESKMNCRYRISPSFLQFRNCNHLQLHFFLIPKTP